MKLTKKNQKLGLIAVFVLVAILFLNGTFGSLAVINSDTFNNLPDYIVNNGAVTIDATGGYSGSSLHCVTNGAAAYAFVNKDLAAGYSVLYCSAQYKITGVIGPLEYANVMEFLTAAWDFPIKVRAYGAWYAGLDSPAFGISYNGEDYVSDVPIVSGQYYKVALYINENTDVAQLYINDALEVTVNSFVYDIAIASVDVGNSYSGVSTSLAVDVDDYITQDSFPTATATPSTPPTTAPTDTGTGGSGGGGGSSTPTPTTTDDITNPGTSPTPTETAPNGATPTLTILAIVIIGLVLIMVVRRQKK